MRHGEMVWEEFKKLIDTKFIGTFLEQYSDKILNLLYDENIIKEYCIYHDIGKPKSLIIDEDGKKHYPNHANISSNLYKKYNQNNPDVEIISRLIKHDMDIHTLSFEEIIKNTNTESELVSLLVVSLAETHANRLMFGEQSFKIKIKKLQQKGKEILNYLFEKPYMYVLIRNDLSIPQRAVQASHACIESAKKFVTKQHPSVIICAVKNENDLLNACAYLTNNNIKYEKFLEPDIDYSLTAVASEPIYTIDRKKFSKFQLMK